MELEVGQAESGGELELKSELGKEVGVGKEGKVVVTPQTLMTAKWRRPRRTNRPGKPGFILRSRLKSLSFAGAPGLLKGPGGDFPPGRFTGKEEAAREHVTTQEGEDTQGPESSAHQVLGPTLPAARRPGYHLPNINSNELVETPYLVSDLTLP